MSAILLGYIFRKRIAAHYIPQVEQAGVIHINLKNDTSFIDFDLIVTNKTILKIEVDTVRYKVMMVDKTYLERRQHVGVVLPGSGKDTIQVLLKVPHAAILKDLGIERKKGDSTSYSVQLYLKCRTIFGETEFSINRVAKLKIPQMPDLEIVTIKWNKGKLNSIQAVATLKFTNYSAVSLAIKDLNYDMEVLNKVKLNGNYHNAIVIKPNAETFATIPIAINTQHIFKTIFEVITNNDKYDYTLKLNATLETRDSLKENFRINLIKSGKMELKK